MWRSVPFDVRSFSKPSDQILDQADREGQLFLIHSIEHLIEQLQKTNGCRLNGTSACYYSDYSVGVVATMRTMLTERERRERIAPGEKREENRAGNYNINISRTTSLRRRKEVSVRDRESPIRFHARRITPGRRCRRVCYFVAKSFSASTGLQQDDRTQRARSVCTRC